MKELTREQYDALKDIVLTRILAIYGCITVINLMVYSLHYLVNLKF